MQEIRNKYVKFRVSQREYNLLKEYSRQTGKSMSELFRDFLEYQVKTNLNIKNKS